jgi:hypothetical protein
MKFKRRRRQKEKGGSLVDSDSELLGGSRPGETRDIELDTLSGYDPYEIAMGRGPDIGVTDTPSIKDDLSSITSGLGSAWDKLAGSSDETKLDIAKIGSQFAKEISDADIRTDLTATDAYTSTMQGVPYTSRDKYADVGHITDVVGTYGDLIASRKREKRSADMQDLFEKAMRKQYEIGGDYVDNVAPEKGGEDRSFSRVMELFGELDTPVEKGEATTFNMWPHSDDSDSKESIFDSIIPGDKDLLSELESDYVKELQMTDEEHEQRARRAAEEKDQRERERVAFTGLLRPDKTVLDSEQIDVEGFFDRYAKDVPSKGLVSTPVQQEEWNKAASQAVKKEAKVGDTGKSVDLGPLASSFDKVANTLLLSKALEQIQAPKEEPKKDEQAKAIEAAAAQRVAAQFAIAAQKKKDDFIKSIGQSSSPQKVVIMREGL